MLGVALFALSALLTGGAVQGAVPAAGGAGLTSPILSLPSWAPLPPLSGNGAALVRNGGFESAAPLAEGARRWWERYPNGWQAIGRGVGRIDGEVGRAGKRSGRLIGLDEAEFEEGPDGAERQVAWSQRLQRLRPGQRYRLTGWVRSEAPGAVAYLAVGPFQDEGESIVYRGLARPGAWEPLSLEFAAPPSGAARILLGGHFRGSLWWDEVALTLIDDRPEELAAEWLERLFSEGRIHTGLVIDARRLGIERAMSPRVFDETGALIYGGVGVDPSELVSHGVVAYATEIAEAAGHPRLSVNSAFPYRLPMIVQAIGVAPGNVPGSVVIDNADAGLIRAALRQYDFLGRFAVVFLIDPR